ncbi:mediator of RNA polymerase II transcription subunit 20-like [Haliotis rubra]|uniref:mediator of RNA polymerase II transcription subunit 20-like n=1 Tax=Haliotis rubra TaxID=36100 RepID=UPI001EE5E22F|nr:mediator of RNA polymerase II transcription subunit 20-like [Haliotis rubra]
MGVVCVYLYPVPEGKSGQQVVDTLQRQTEQLGAVKAGNFCVDCETFQSTFQQGAQQKQLSILHNSEYPATCFAILDSGTSLVADDLFDGLVQKLKNYYQQRKGFKIESKGQRYELGDFVIKIGSVTLTSNFKGILVEVEYCPCVVPNDCWNLMKELLQSILGSSITDNPPSYLKSKMDILYSTTDTMSQYLEHFNNIRKSASTTGSTTPPTMISR